MVLPADVLGLGFLELEFSLFLSNRFIRGILLLGGTPVSTESLSLAEVAGELGRETLQRLKRECGGLQTLLRNNRQVFEGEQTKPLNTF